MIHNSCFLIHDSRKGLTLIEIVLIAAFVSLVGFLSAIFYSNFYLKSAARNVQNELTFELRKAQTYSMASREASGWGVTIAGGSIILYKGNSYASRDPAFDEAYIVPSAVGISGFNETDFARITGYPGATSTVLITGAASVRTVTVQPQGIVSQF